MKTFTMDEFALLPEVQAVRKHFDAFNYRLLRLCFLGFGGLGLGWLIYGVAGGGFRYAVAGILGLTLNLGLFLARRGALFERFFGLIVPAYAALQLIVPGVFLDAWTAEPVPIFLLIALFLFLLQPAEHILLFGALWLVSVLALGRPDAMFHSGAGLTWTVASWMIGALVRAQISRRRFLKRWRALAAHTRERLRLREELESARRIQLGMLPHADLHVDWLELAAVSVPATEVGGDYYDYFRLPGDRLALVIADVAGHGLAAALLLSGVRSCLYLLAPDLATPVAVLERLTGMVRATSRRTFVTLLIAVLDRAAGVVRVAAAGHPPALLWQAETGEITALGEPAAALGTFVGSSHTEVSHPFRPGDRLLLYTDGLVEARNARGEEYGEARLRRLVGSAARRGGAHEVRAALLSDLSSFRGNAEPADDFTVVVAALR